MGGQVDRLFLISNSGRRKMKPMRFRYLSKSVFSHCNGDDNAYEYINFRGAHLSKSSIKNASFIDLRFPIYYEGSEGDQIRLLNEKTVETVVLLRKSSQKLKPDTYVKFSLDMEDYYRIKDAEKEKNKTS